jgi:hypothetical protein
VIHEVDRPLEGPGPASYARGVRLVLGLPASKGPWYAKVFVAGLVAYAFSPIDLIPAFIRRTDSSADQGSEKGPEFPRPSPGRHAVERDDVWLVRK